MAKENFSLSAKDFAGTFFFMNVPVVELDTIKASDAFGPGSSPGGHTILAHAKGALRLRWRVSFLYRKQPKSVVFERFWLGYPFRCLFPLSRQELNRKIFFVFKISYRLNKKDFCPSPNNKERIKNCFFGAVRV